MAAPIQSPTKCEVRSVIRFKFKWEILDHTPDLASKDLQLFLHLKKYLAGKKFDDDDDEVQEEVMTWFKVQAAEFYDSGIQKLVLQDLINVCTMPAAMLKNKVIYRQFIHSVVFVN